MCSKFDNVCLAFPVHVYIYIYIYILHTSIAFVDGSYRYPLLERPTHGEQRIL
jgi:hypothetical protein